MPWRHSLTSDDIDQRQVIEKPFREHQITQYGVSVRNDGHHTVTGVGDQAADFAGRTDSQLAPAGTKMSRNEFANDPLLPFAAFKLKPGQERYLVLSVRIPACANFAAGSAVGVDDFEVRYRVFAFHRTQRIPLRTPIRIVRGKRCA